MKYSLKEYILYISLRLASKISERLPLKVVILFGKALGTAVFYIDKKHKDIAYKNLRIALAREMTVLQLKKILKRNFQNFGMNVMEVLRFAKIDKGYVDKYVEIEGEDNLKSALKLNRGAILLSIHMGNWEICFAVTGILNYPLYILVEEQIKNPLLDKFLNQMRESKGIRILKASSQMREVIQILKENKIIGLVADHGIKEGVAADFFGRKTLTPTVAIRLALRLDVPLLPAYIRRIQDGRYKVLISQVFNLKKTGDFNRDISYNLTAINKIFEDYIRLNPSEYYWAYKRFKYNQDREILVLTDGKAGHERQVRACLKLIHEIGKEKKLEIKVKQIKIDFKNKLYKNLQMLSVGLANKSCCRGCLWCLKTFLKPECFLELRRSSADIVISCGSSLAGINFVLSAENSARSVVIMRPGILSTKRFDLVIMPRHDNPPKRKNVLVTEGALNLIDETYLKEQSAKLRQLSDSDFKLSDLRIGLLIGGDTRNFFLRKDSVLEVIKQIKYVAERDDADILVTTSRRTSEEIEGLIKEEFKDYPRCKLLVIANEKNLPDAVASILGLSHVVVISPESISMISESASSGSYVLVFNQRQGLGKRHNRFLDRLNQDGYIYLKEIPEISKTLEHIFVQRPSLRTLKDSLKVRKALEELL